MSLRVVFLGTAGSIPTPKRNLSAIVIRRKEELLLFDCGEGIQRQMIQAKVGFHRKTKIFITHLHGDHILGLPGLFQTMSLWNRRKKLEVHGPRGIKAFVDAMKQTVQFTLTFPMEIFEIKNSGVMCNEKQYEVYAVWADHSVQSLAYALIEKPRPGKFYPEKARSIGVPEGPLWSKLQQGCPIKLSNGRTVKPEEVVDPPRLGRKIVYTGDTKPSEDIIKLADKADLLIHEATFSDELQERAHEDKHSTPSQAAKVAKKARVRRLVLTHISARYKDPTILLEQAKKIFPNVCVAEDFMRIDIPFFGH
ncbi:ribonuclease Z [Candidatus Bathyarchaeota archaeon]|nr:ribonuclease Z [Candidatus Bathyarchaeota archaeon]